MNSAAAAAACVCNQLAPQAIGELAALVLPAKVRFAQKLTGLKYIQSIA